MLPLALLIQCLKIIVNFKIDNFNEIKFIQISLLWNKLLNSYYGYWSTSSGVYIGVGRGGGGEEMYMYHPCF